MCYRLWEYRYMYLKSWLIFKAVQAACEFEVTYTHIAVIIYLWCTQLKSELIWSLLKYKFYYDFIKQILWVFWNLPPLTPSQKNCLFRMLYPSMLMENLEEEKHGSKQHW